MLAKVCSVMAASDGRRPVVSEVLGGRSDRKYALKYARISAARLLAYLANLSGATTNSFQRCDYKHRSATWQQAYLDNATTSIPQWCDYMHSSKDTSRGWSKDG